MTALAMRRRCLRPAAVVGCLLVLAGCAPRRERHPAGGELYLRYCASCHGMNGTGDGPVAKWLQPRPADLTQSTLDLPALVDRIDGRRMVPGHGSSEMPVWAEVFNEELLDEPRAREITRLRVQALAEHVRSLRAAR
jgi:mono/diheme cytochrome c family protein